MPIKHVSVNIKGGNFSGASGGTSIIAGILRENETLSIYKIIAWLYKSSDSEKITDVYGWTFKFHERYINNQYVVAVVKVVNGQITYDVDSRGIKNLHYTWEINAKDIDPAKWYLYIDLYYSIEGVF